MTAAPAATFSTQSWPQRLWEDLQPAPGRLAATLRIVLATLLALVLMMVLQMPFASLGLYFIFLVVRESPATSARTGFIALLTLALAVAAALAVVIVTDNDPGARLISVAVASFVAGCLMAASPFGALASIWGFIYCTVIALWERPAPADALVTSSLYLVATVALAFVCTVTVEYLFAYRHAADRLAEQINLRYRTIEGVFTLFANGAPAAQLGGAIAGLNRLAATGQRPMLELYAVIVARGLETSKLPVGTRVRIPMLAQLTDVAAAFASNHPAGVGPELRGRCAEIARRCRERTVADAPDGSGEIEGKPGLLERVEAALHTILSMPIKSVPAKDAAGDDDLVALPANRVPFLIPGALGNKDTIAFALKLTLCVMICYVFYFAVAWPGISTSVTTIFITALGNSGAIKQKLANRFLGSAIGGALAIGATAFLFPRMDSITSLVVLIAVVAFVAAWWAAGRQFGYAGMQIAFAFYLVAFEGFSAPTELAPARDRLAGILVALVVIWFVFDQIWPVRTVTAMRRTLAGILRGEARFLRVFESGVVGSKTAHKARLQQVDGLRDQIGKAIAGLRTMNDTVVFEFGLDRERHMRTSEAILQAALTAVPFFWNQLAVLHNERDQDFLSEPGLIELRRKVAAHLDAMADAVTREAGFDAVEEAELADAPVMGSARYGEYARNTVAGHEELQRCVAALTALSA